jgi:hypothetical protein
MPPSTTSLIARLTDSHHGKDLPEEQFISSAAGFGSTTSGDPGSQGSCNVPSYDYEGTTPFHGLRYEYAVRSRTVGRSKPLRGGFVSRSSPPTAATVPRPPAAARGRMHLRSTVDSQPDNARQPRPKCVVRQHGQKRVSLPHRCGHCSILGPFMHSLPFLAKHGTSPSFSRYTTTFSPPQEQGSRTTISEVPNVPQMPGAPVSRLLAEDDDSMLARKREQARVPRIGR